MQNELLVIIVTYNGMQWIQKCVGSVLGSNFGADVFIVDNGSTDGTRELLAKMVNSNGRIILHNTNSNYGFAKANNIGLEYALLHNYDYVYLLNQDAWVEPDTFELLIEAFKSYPQYGLLSPVQMQADNVNMDRNFKKHCGCALKLCSGDVVKVRFVMAAHWMITHQALEKVGLFSPRFPHYGEDENWIDRLHYAGLCSGVVRSARAVHDRASRQTPKDVRIRHKFIGCRVRVCNPAAPFYLCYFVQILKLIGMGIKNFSILPLKFIPEFISEAKYNKSIHEQK